MSKEPKKQNVVRQILSCIIEKYNGYQAISIEFVRKERKNFKPIDIIHKPTKNPEKSPLCCFTKDISKAYHNLHRVGNKAKHSHAYECYYCRRFFTREDRQKTYRKLLRNSWSDLQF